MHFLLKDVKNYDTIFELINNNNIKIIKQSNELGILLNTNTTLNYNTNLSTEYHRFLYYNAVTTKVILDMLTDIENKSICYFDFEIDSVYGNNTLPMIKVFGDYDNFYLQKLPHVNEIKHSNGINQMGIRINSQGTHLVYYMHVLSNIEKDSYINIQLRPKGIQYVVDGQAYIDRSTFNKIYNI